MSHKSAQMTELFKLTRILFICLMALTLPINLETSAYSFMTTCINSGKSLMKITKKIVPRTLPWGIPDVTFLKLE